MIACEGTFSLRSNPLGHITADKRLANVRPNASHFATPENVRCNVHFEVYLKRKK